MADKEATVYIVDLGRSMGVKRHGRTESDLDWAMTYVWDKITNTVATERKTATLETDNDSGAQDGFQNLSVLQEIGQLLLPGLKALHSKIAVSDNDDGDAISAIVVAIQMISAFCKKLKYVKKIVLVTDARGNIEGEDIPQIIEKLKADDIELVVIGTDFDDVEYGFKEEDKDPVKLQGEQTLQNLVDGCGGLFGTMQQAIEELGIPRLKITRPVPSYRGRLTLGNPEQYDSAMLIDVERFPRIMIRRPLTASNYVEPTKSSIGDTDLGSSTKPAPVANGSGRSTTPPTDPSANMSNPRTYQVTNENGTGAKIEVKREDLAKGYEYGRTAVHISESDLNVTKLETQAGLEIIGFVPWATYERYMNMSVSCVIIAQKSNSKAIIALSSLIHALFELETYAVARLVTKPDKEPLITLLAPSIEVDYECLLDVQLPFAEDLRSYKFPPLDKVITVSGKKIVEHRNLPSDELSMAMSDYVDRMDLSNAGKDDEGNSCEYMQILDTYSPVLHRINQAVRWRAVHPTDPIPPPYEVLTRYCNPPEHLVNRSKRRLETLANVADVKKVPTKTQSRKRARADVKPLSGLDVHALLKGKAAKLKITKENAIPEFRQALDSAESPDVITDAAKQFGTIIKYQIENSFADSAYGGAIEKLGVLRDEMIDVDEPAIYNSYINALKRELLGEHLNGDRSDFWILIRNNKLGLVPKSVSPLSKVEEEEAKAFLYSR